MHHHDRTPRRLALPVLALGAAAGLVVLLAGCSSVGSTSADTTAAGQVALAAVDGAFSSAAAADGSDLAPASLTATSAIATAQSVPPVLVVRRTHMRRQRRLVSVVFDQQPAPTSAEVQVWVKITGAAEIWKTYPATGAPTTLLGTKPIDLEGTITFGLTKGSDGWRLGSVAHSGLSQGAYAASVASVGFTPDPIIIGRNDNVATVGLTEPDASDAFLVVARGRGMAPHGVLGDNGVPPDATANDGVYTGYVSVGTTVRPGPHLAFLTALDYSRTIDLGQTGGAYDDPYTFTLDPVLVQLAAGE